MNKLLMLLLFSRGLFANEIEVIDLTSTWLGYLVLILFAIGYYFIAMEEKYKVDKAIPALFVGISSFILIALYYYINNMNVHHVHNEIENVILEVSEIFFFLFVAMIYIESLIHMGVFDSLKYNLISRGYTYRGLFWVTGFLAFFLSPIADNLTTALILSNVLITIERSKKEFLIPSAINIVVAANAGGAWSPFGDITTLMVWSAGKGTFGEFIYLFPSAFIGYLLTAFLLSRIVPNEKPKHTQNERKPELLNGAKGVIALGILTITIAVLSHQFLDFPPMWGMMFGLVLLKLYSIQLNKKNGENYLDVFNMMTKIDNNTLMFFIGILSAVGALYFIGWLNLAATIYEPQNLGVTSSNILVGFLSAIIDNVPVMSAIIESNPTMDTSGWMLVTLTAGIGGSLISFGSAAGVGVMGKLHGIYTFWAHFKYIWAVLLGYILSVLVWYVQFEILGIK